MVILDPSQVNNTMMSYTVRSAADFLAVLAVANARNCTEPCSTIVVEADITLAPDQTLAVNGSVVILGACADAPCKVDGGGATQLLRVSGYYGYAEVSNLEFANGKRNDASKGVFGGAVEVFQLGKAIFTNCKFTSNSAGQGGAVAAYSGAARGWGSGTSPCPVACPALGLRRCSAPALLARLQRGPGCPPSSPYEACSAS
jgi:hypothetical protein